MKLAKKKESAETLLVCNGSGRTHPPTLYCFSLIQFQIRSRAKRKVLKQKQKGFWCSRAWCVITTAVIFEVGHKEKGESERGGKLLGRISFVHGDTFNLQSGWLFCFCFAESYSFSFNRTK